MAKQQNIIETDSPEFTDLEISHFLGKKDFLTILEKQKAKTFLVQSKTSSIVETLSIEEYERLFSITYYQYPFFSSYKLFCAILNQCPYILRSQKIAEENHALAKKYHLELQHGVTAPLSIRWIDETVGYGVFAEENLSAGTFLAEYTGVIRQLNRKHPDHNAYCLHYPTKWWSLNYFVLDALPGGNISRFVNHSDTPNAQPYCLVDRRLLRLVLIAKEPITRGQQVTFDYGCDFWRSRQKREILMHP